MDPKHKELAEQIYNSATFSLAETGNDSPLFIIIKDNQVTPILIPPGFEVDISGYAMLSLHYAQEAQADALIIISSMWVVLENVEALETGIRPSEHPDREHYFNLIYFSADGKEIESIAGKVETDISGTKFVREHDWLDSVQAFDWLQPWK
jgi:hypothetical protein